MIKDENKNWKTEFGISAALRPIFWIVQCILIDDENESL